jgi:hypothetical protein
MPGSSSSESICSVVRSVIVRTTDRRDPLETVRISNDPESLARVMARAGEGPQVVLEATYGWYWAADALSDLGAQVHLAHPSGVKAFSYRRVKNDVRDATDLVDRLRMGRLPPRPQIVSRKSGDVCAGVAGEGHRHMVGQVRDGTQVYLDRADALDQYPGAGCCQRCCFHGSPTGRVG